MSIQPWSSALIVRPDTGRFDKVTLFHAALVQLRQGDDVEGLADRLEGRQIITGGASWATARWNRQRMTGPLHLSAPNKWPELFAVAKLTLTEPRVSAPNVVPLRCSTNINPSRMRSFTRAPDLGIWFSGITSGSGIVRERVRPDREPSPVVNPGAILDASRAVESVAVAVAESIFGRGRFDRTSLQYVECYWHFSVGDPDRALDELASFLRSQGGSRRILRRDVTGQSETGIPVVIIGLTLNINLALYKKRDQIIRAEVRYLRRVANAVPGAGSGTFEERFTAIAQSAAGRLNKFLEATIALRGERQYEPNCRMRDLIGLVDAVVGNPAERDGLLGTLLSERGIIAGPEGSIELNAAQRLVRRRVVMRNPIRARDIGGRRFALHSRFSHLPPGAYY